MAQLTALSIVAAALLAACSSSSTSSTTTAPSGGTLSSTNAAYIASDLKAPAGSLIGSGSTFVQPFFTKAFYTYTSLNSGLQVNYSTVGSGTGISDFQSGSVTFAASDVPMSSSDLAKVPASPGPVIQIPDILGGVSVSYNLPGVSSRLRLDAATIAGIFDGSIKTWNASQITALNPGMKLPSNAIVPEVRADSSGTTYIFSDYLATAAPRCGRWVEQDHQLALERGPDTEELRRGGQHQVDPVLDRLCRVGIRPAEQLHLRRSQERSRCVRGALAATVAADADQRPNISPTDFSIVNEPGADQLPDLGLQLGDPVAEADQRHDRAQVVKVLDWTTHTGGGQDQAAGLGYVVSRRRSRTPTGPAVDGDRTERAGAAHPVMPHECAPQKRLRG